MTDNGKPFFSILLPTKNRSEIVHNAIDSVISQDFSDFELVIADNDDTDKTAIVVNGYTDERIKYHRTGQMSMSENWNYAYSKSRGKYILLIEDKYIIKPHALEILRQYIDKYNPEVVSWRLNPVSLEKKGCRNITGVSTPKIYSSDELLNWFFEMKFFIYWRFFHTIPRGSNSCISRDLYEAIVDKTSVLCMDNAPDFTQGYQILFNCDKILNLDLTLYGIFTQNKKYSIGALHDSGSLDSAKNELNSKSTSITVIKYQPVNIAYSLTIIVEDFIRISELYNAGYSFKNFNESNYYTNLYENIIYRQIESERSGRAYFIFLRRTIKDTIKAKKPAGRRLILLKCRVLDIAYYPLSLILSLYRIYQKGKNFRVYKCNPD
ncbi:glycosyltransferase family 2 protein [Methanolacinia paynteri]|uniref:glycosyltransferase family 2 protein n=1 Tax=Methanolacinia paynteri TaxID=230356 RepID=UPI00064FBFFD|nr:glycosyltransferase family 2 protein [Methanolacinia paynteri]